MSHQILPPTTPTTQELAREAVDRNFVDQVAELLLRRDLRDPRACLAQLPDDTSRDSYRADAALALLTRDEARHRPALYAAASKFVGQPIEKLTPNQRTHLVATIDETVRAYRRGLNDRSDRARELGLLALEDIEAMTTMRSA